MEKGDYITSILRSRKTVFTFKDIALLWGEAGTNTSRVRINYYVKNGKIIRLRRGIYAKDNDYNKLELATKIITPSYVSFETVLAMAGIIFQYYEKIFVASYLTRDIVCDNQGYSFRKIKSSILTDNAGVENKNECSIATKERAFLDTLYINQDYHFDNLEPLDWDKVFNMLPLYHNKRMEKKVKELAEDYADVKYAEAILKEYEKDGQTISLTEAQRHLDKKNIVKKISHITFICKNLGKTSNFLKQVFNAKEIYSSGDKTFSIAKEKFFKIGELWIAIMEGKPVARSYNHIAFVVDAAELPALRSKIKKLGLKIFPGRKRKAEEGESLYFYDYDNHLFELHAGNLEARLTYYNQN